MNKNLGQVFTPKDVVQQMLTLIKYNDARFLTKKILEPSCGDGAFLVEIVTRYIKMARVCGYSDRHISMLLETYIYGIEIDTEVYLKCLDNLNNTLESLNFKEIVNWKVYNEDALKKVAFYGMFDYVVGNPPYVRIHNLSKETRDFIKHNYSLSGKGMVDLFVAFYEYGLNCLNKNGALSFISPNSMCVCSNFAKFRESVKQNNLLDLFYDYKQKVVFKDISTYSCICQLRYNRNVETFDYYEDVEGIPSLITSVNLRDIACDKWIFSDKEKQKFLNSIFNSTDKLSHHCNVQYGIETLRNNIYISSNVQGMDSSNNIVTFNGSYIEKSILKPIVKANKFEGGEPYEYIIFPYTYSENNKPIPFDEDYFRNNFPLAYGYLLSHKEELLKRTIEKNKKWFEFGRSQGLSNLNQSKITVKSIVNTMRGQVFSQILPKNTLVYGGIFISGEDLERIKRTLDSSDFFLYSIEVGKHMRGGYRAISPNNIKVFPLLLESEA